MAVNEQGHYGKYSGNARCCMNHAHTRVDRGDYKATERDDAAHIDYLKRDVLYDAHHGHEGTASGGVNINLSVVIGAGGGFITLFNYLDNSTLPNLSNTEFFESKLIAYGPSGIRIPSNIVAQLEWTTANQGGDWRPLGFNNRKTGKLNLNQGTYNLSFSFIGRKIFPPSGAIEFVAGVEV